MSAEQGFSNNKITAKKTAVYALLVAACLVLSYVESLLPLSFIAPGVKIGLANSVALILAYKGDRYGAVLVNIARILLSSLLFGSAVSLVFSLCAGAASLVAIILFSKIKSVSVIGASVAAAAVHNTVQIAIATYFYGRSVWFYLPVLLLCGAVGGTVTGIISLISLKKIKTNGIF